MLQTFYRYILTFLLVAVCFSLSAQQDRRLLTIEGTVSDASGALLAGVSINIKQATRGVLTSVNGTFSIKASYGDILVFSYIGCDSHECLVTGETKNLTISLYDGMGQIPNNPMTTTSSDSEWQRIDALEASEALAEIEKIYRSALGEKDYPKVVKAITRRMMRQRQLTDNTTATLLDSLKLDAERLPQPAKSIVYSIMADVLRVHHRTNQNKIIQRTRTAVDDDDINTWSISRLFEESLKYFKCSIQDEEILQQTPVDDYGESLFCVFGEDKHKLTLPTLYDLLVYRAILAYSGELSVTLPQQTFVVNQPAYFADVPIFTHFPLPLTDTLSAEYQTLSLYQKLLRFRQQQPDDAANRYALVSVDIERLRYVYDKGRYTNNDVLFEKALSDLIDRQQAHHEKYYAMYALAMLYKNQAFDWSNTKNDALRNKYLEAFDLCEQIAASGDSLMTFFAREMQEDIRKPAAELKMNYLQNPQTPMLAYISYRNMNRLYLHFYQLNDEEAMKHHNQWMFSDFIPEKSNLFKTQTIDLPSQPDYQRYSAEIRLDALPQGIYVVLASDSLNLPNDGVGAYSGKLTTGFLFQVSAIAAVVNNGPIESSEILRNPRISKMQAYLTDNKTGEPVKNGEITYYRVEKDSTLNQIGVYSSDQHGMVSISEDSITPKIKMVATRKNDRFVFFNGFSTYRTIPSRHEVVFFTDRSIYRPGQTVYYKILCFENQQLLSDKQATVDFMDVNSKKIASQELKTGEYGTAQGSFVIPQGLLNGVIILICKINDKNSYHFIRLEEYKRPTFELVYNPVEGNYRLNDSVRISGKANALAGYAIDHAQVTYRVVRTEQLRYRYWWAPPVRARISSLQREITSGTTVTRSDGSFDIIFKAEADDILDDSLIYIYTVTTDITDVNGETRSATQTVKISKKPLLIETNIPEKIVNRDSLSFNLLTVNLNGEITPAEVVFTLYELKSPTRIKHERLWGAPDTFSLSRAEFEKSFPFDIYSDEDNPETFPVVRQLTEQKLNRADDKIIQLDALKQAKTGWYRVDIKARSTDYDTWEEQRQYIQLAGSPVVKNEPITGMKDWLTVVGNVCEPGENMEFLIAGGYEKSYIHYDILLKNSVIEHNTLITGTTPQRLIIPVKEEYRGGVDVQFVMIQNQRVYNQNVRINVPHTNKQLKVAFTTFHDKLLPGEQEKWTLSVKNRQGDKEMAEMVATLYDASLDLLASHNWVDINMFNNPLSDYGSFRLPVNQIVRTSAYVKRFEKIAEVYHPLFPLLMTYPSFQAKSSLDEVTIVAFGTQRRETLIGSSGTTNMLGGRISGQSGQSQNEFYIRGIPESNNPAEIATRRNFNETAFFYPQLHTDENGEISIEFTVPEALTRWKMLGFTHTKDLKVGAISGELVTQKQLAISANTPRFFRENDRIEFSAKVNSLTDSNLTGQATLRLYDAINMQPIDVQVIHSPQTQAFSVKAGESVGLKWTLIIPEGMQAITYKVTAQAGNHTDGEEKTVPVIANTMLVTETMPFSIRGGKQKTFTFKRLKETKSTTLRNHRLTLEFSSTPAWYAVQAIPYMMEYPYECSEQVFTRFYANSLASTIANRSPRIRQVFDLWRSLPENKETLLSNLEKNQELKYIFLEETPWVMQANSETERKKRLGLLFDFNRMSYEQQQTFDKLQKMQLNDGGFPWFGGMPSNRFITQHIIAGIAHLQALNALENDFTTQVNTIVSKGLNFMDACILEDYNTLLKSRDFDANKQYITPIQLQYLYACSFSHHHPENEAQSEAFEFYLSQAVRYWKSFNLYSQAMTALALYRYGDSETSSAIIRSLKGRAQKSEELGLYWRDNKAGYFWYQAPIETQAMLIEAFNEITNDREAVEEMKIWLLCQKQTDDWYTTKATAEACYALLMTGDNLLDESLPLEVNIGGKPVVGQATSSEPGTGYMKISWNGNDIQKEMAMLEASNPNSSGIIWGGVYWQYFERLDKITASETNLRINKQLFLSVFTERGEELRPVAETSKLKVGDLVKVRMDIYADRDYEYVHLKDMHASAFEPVSTVSGHRYQDGLWYYESIKDASSNFFITNLPKGTYVFEYSLRVTHVGDFSNGITTFQCMYASEFSAHSEGVRVTIAE